MYWTIRAWRKNATLESIEKVAAALDVSLSELFQKIGTSSSSERNISLECYELLASKTLTEQEQLYRIVLEMDKYKGNA